MNKHIIRVSKWAGLRRGFRGLGLHRVYNAWLSRFPRVRRVGGQVYRARRTESVSLALELLEGGDCYEARFLPEGFRTFLDLGCNVGYFAVWLYAQAQERALMGYMVDGNARVIEEAKWHVRTNAWKGVVIVEHAAVGVPVRDGRAQFFVQAADTVSTGRPPAVDLKRFYQEITVPGIRFMGGRWKRLFGDVPCDVLKLDIEGSELDFLRVERAFLKGVRVIFCEYHKDRVTFAELERFLAREGFVCVQHVTSPAQGDGMTVWRRGQ